MKGEVEGLNKRDLDVIVELQLMVLNMTSNMCMIWKNAENKGVLLFMQITASILTIETPRSLEGVRALGAGGGTGAGGFLSHGTGGVGTDGGTGARGVTDGGTGARGARYSVRAWSKGVVKTPLGHTKTPSPLEVNFILFRIFVVFPVGCLYFRTFKFDIYLHFLHHLYIFSPKH